MQTIQLQIQDDLYDSVVSKGIDINNHIQDFLYNLVDDGFSSISTNEAKQRVSDAVDRYKNNTGTYLNQEEYSKYRSNLIKSLS